MSSQALSEASGALLQFIRGQRQNARLLQLHFPREDGPSALMVANRLDATEGLSRDFHFVVEVLSDQPDIALKDVLGKMVSIELLRDDGSSRFFNGHVFEFRFVKNEGGFAYYDMVLLPWLAFLRLTRNNRLFHFKTVEQQTAQLLGECPHADWRSQQLGSDPVMTDACQFDESNYNYLHRRWEALGWHYWYEHSKSGHTLVISGDSTACEPLDGGAAVPWKGDAGVREPGVQGLTPVRNVASTSFSASSFDFKRPRPQMADTPTLNQQGDIPPLEVYEYAGAYGYADAGAGRDYVRRRMEEIEAAAKHFVAVSDFRGMQPGRYFQLTGHVMSESFGLVDDGDDTSFLVLEVRHSASNNFETQQGQVSHYQAQLSCLRKKVPWRPGRSHNSIEPKIYGLQTAIVVGPAGEEIHTDEYGRVRVQFHWDREGTFDDKSSAWVRVASTWAGSNFGFVAIPRIGQEVLVQFLDGNPDRPLITGRVYNQDNMPPWELPANKTQTGILSRSSKGGGYENANAIRFEDKKGQEEVWLHAEKDQRIEVEHDESHWVGHDRSKTIDHDETVHVKHDRTETVDHDETITVHNDRKERVDHNETISIGDNRTEDVGQNETITIGQNQTVSIGSNRSVTIGGMKTETITLAKAETIGLAKALTVGGAYQTTVGGLMNTTVALQQMEQVGLNKSSKVGKTYRLEAGDRIELVCGDSKIVLTPQAIYLDGPEVHIKSGSYVHVDGPSDILMNGGSALSAPSGDDAEEAGADGQG
ncbi:type VI secretion system Vgr family protein [Roseateles flavus]|uniref:Type VI secretion system tip protein TssI/VgrG n=3 Tax=Roseateles TaxID=93681 RepID=A0ABV0G8H6_9BURK